MVDRVVRRDYPAFVPARVVVAVLLLAATPAATQSHAQAGAGVLSDLEVRFKPELERARADQREDQTTLTAGQALLEDARAAKDPAAAPAPQPAGNDGLPAEPSKAELQDTRRWWEESP